MLIHLSKSAIKAKALEYFRQIETTGEPIIVTDHGEAKLEIRKYKDPKANPLLLLKGSVLKYESPFEPINQNDWEALAWFYWIRIF